jgi:uncharacterized protein
MLRRYAIARSLFAPTTLAKAIERLGFVQADPIRAPARAQDLTLRHRVKGYVAGDLERRYPQLEVEEDAFVNYGFLPRAIAQLMHPRQPRHAWTRARTAQAQAVLAFVRERGQVHPREVDAHFDHGKTTNWFGGSTNASTQLLDEMHHRGLVRIATRESGVRVYAAREVHPPVADPDAALDALLDVAVGLYAPLPERTLSSLAYRLRFGAPQLAAGRRGALVRAKARLASATVDGATWYWPAAERPASARPHEVLRLLAPFDPVVWDRLRFEAFWGWAYRFEAYTPAPKRQRGYYALPVLWREHVVGWANLSVRDGHLEHEVGFVTGRAPRERGFGQALEDELDRVRRFLGT